MRVFALAEGVFEKVADAQTPQPVLAAVRFDQRRVDSIPTAGLILVLHDLKDPGNVGHDYPLRRRRGGHGRRLDRAIGGPLQPQDPARQRRLDLPSARRGRVDRRHAGPLLQRGAVARDRRARRTRVTETSTSRRQRRRHRQRGRRTGRRRPSHVARQSISIPMAGRSESLNAGVAASLIAFEALWQRRDAAERPPPPRSL